jgi:ferrous iron transport protein A
VRLDQWPLGSAARITGIAWDMLSVAEARRLRELGFDEGVPVEPLHRGAWKGPLSCRIGRMTIAMRGTTAAAISVEAA